MRILLDENLDWRLARGLLGHEVESVPRLGWAGIQNGLLLTKAEETGFEVLITMDSKMSFQQNLALSDFRHADTASKTKADWYQVVQQGVQIEL